MIICFQRKTNKLLNTKLLSLSQKIEQESE